MATAALMLLGTGNNIAADNAVASDQHQHQPRHCRTAVLAAQRRFLLTK
jgi:hypothetical protein